MFSDKQPNNKANVGKLGEELACEYLVKSGYKVLKRNYREKWGEIDIIGKAIDGTLVFFEVKALGGSESMVSNLMPEDHATAAKLKKFRRICQIFVAKHPNLIDESKGWRMDLVAIVIAGVNPADSRIVGHYENI